MRKHALPELPGSGAAKHGRTDNGRARACTWTRTDGAATSEMLLLRVRWRHDRPASWKCCPPLANLQLGRRPGHKEVLASGCYRAEDAVPHFSWPPDTSPR